MENLPLNRRVKWRLYQAFREAGMNQLDACLALGYTNRYMPFCTWLPKLPPHIVRKWLEGEINDCRLRELYTVWTQN